MRRILFLTGTRADFGKLKSLMLKLQNDPDFEVIIFVTGMHMLSLYGSTWDEVRKAGLKNIYQFINQNESDLMDHIMAKTINGLSDYVREKKPDLIVVHGDRVETLAGAIVGSLNNIPVAHIEGGEVSGTIDELIRHAVTKLSHIHFVSNEIAKKRIIQLGESIYRIHVIGSPDVEVMNSQSLPSIEEVKRYYNFNFAEYSILLFHPVTTELFSLRRQTSILVDQVIASGLNFVVIYPNNDHGTDVILEEYVRLQNNSKISIYPSMRFEYFLSLLKNSQFIIGNSSAGVIEAPHFGVPAINLGSRQNNRVKTDLVLNIPMEPEQIMLAISKQYDLPRIPKVLFGNGNSAEHFYEVIKSLASRNLDTQKFFIDSL